MILKGIEAERQRQQDSPGRPHDFSEILQRALAAERSLGRERCSEPGDHTISQRKKPGGVPEALPAEPRDQRSGQHRDHRAGREIYRPPAKYRVTVLGCRQHAQEHGGRNRDHEKTGSLQDSRHQKSRSARCQCSGAGCCAN